MNLIARALPTSEQLLSAVEVGFSTSNSAVRHVQVVASNSFSLAATAAKGHCFRSPACFGSILKFTSNHSSVGLLAVSCLFVLLAGPPLLIYFVQMPKERLVAYMVLDCKWISLEIVRTLDPQLQNMYQLAVYLLPELLVHPQSLHIRVGCVNEGLTQGGEPRRNPVLPCGRADFDGAAICTWPSLFCLKLRAV